MRISDWSSDVCSSDLNFDIYVAVTVNVTGTADTVIVHLGNSASGTYSQQHGSPTTITDHNLDAGKGELAYVSGKFVYTDADGTVYTFSSTVPDRKSTRLNSSH